LDQLRKDLAKNVQFGGTLGEFQKGFEAIAGRALSPSQVETVYRTQVSQAVSAGTRAMMANPIVSGAFPYLLWTATHDGRVRPEHLAMEKHGQGGSAVYRADDPMFRLLYPPAGYNCRCHVIPLSLEDAARHGSPEARKWLETGRPPVVPDWARRPYPITLPPGWPVSDRITSVAV
jgi:SPP1 gp7 family putative phage head morphogenesis protein